MENMVCELVLPIFIPKWLNFENLLLFYVLDGVSWFHKTQILVENTNHEYSSTSIN